MNLLSLWLVAVLQLHGGSQRVGRKHKTTRGIEFVYSLEQRCRRKGGELSITEGMFSLLYQWTSDYGRSLIRPVVGLAGVVLAFFLIYPRMLGCELSIAECHRDGFQRAVAVFTIEQVLRPFAIWSPRYSPSTPPIPTQRVVAIERSHIVHALNSKPLLVRIVSTLQSVLCITLIGLFVLALRWKFRRA